MDIYLVRPAFRCAHIPFSSYSPYLKQNPVRLVVKDGVAALIFRHETHAAWMVPASSVHTTDPALVWRLRLYMFIWLYKWKYTLMTLYLILLDISLHEHMHTLWDHVTSAEDYWIVLLLGWIDLAFLDQFQPYFILIFWSLNVTHPMQCFVLHARGSLGLQAWLVLLSVLLWLLIHLGGCW